ncbi:hypothetical protein HK104_007029 [Borealophlyctis nickersoniae]|nr:hypothetical protein HK104_007029 [Borealophlyctis nickersoniae]
MARRRDKVAKGLCYLCDKRTYKYGLCVWHYETHLDARERDPTESDVETFKETFGEYEPAAVRKRKNAQYRTERRVRRNPRPSSLLFLECSRDGCSEPAHIDGECRKHYKRTYVRDWLDEVKHVIKAVTRERKEKGCCIGSIYCPLSVVERSLCPNHLKAVNEHYDQHQQKLRQKPPGICRYSLTCPERIHRGGLCQKHYVKNRAIYAKWCRERRSYADANSLCARGACGKPRVSASYSDLYCPTHEEKFRQTYERGKQRREEKKRLLQETVYGPQLPTAEDRKIFGLCTGRPGRKRGCLNIPESGKRCQECREVKKAYGKKQMDKFKDGTLCNTVWCRKKCTTGKSGKLLLKCEECAAACRERGDKTKDETLCKTVGCGKKRTIGKRGKLLVKCEECAAFGRRLVMAYYKRKKEGGEPTNPDYPSLRAQVLAESSGEIL